MKKFGDLEIMQNLTQPYSISLLPYPIHPSMHAVSWCNMGLAQKLKKCIMHASHFAYSNFLSKLFETSPNYPTNHSSTTTTFWSNSTVATPLVLSLSDLEGVGEVLCQILSIH
jgi:hypothetical protein